MYREKRRKVQINMMEEEDSAEYLQETTFEFAADLSEESDEEEITVVNVPALVSVMNAINVEILAMYEKLFFFFSRDLGT